ncbi:MAG: helix-turn-helix domain-containing protein [candidate division KSB1 bacterium]|nr:helix-turn-helix domain-containing protein [candidate division KSB1 bacterium]
MIDEKTKYKILQKILTSQEFKHSSLHQNLLQFLVKACLDKKTIKEQTIAEHLFHKKAFNPAEDTSVRVSVYKLRKKLEQYYSNSGKKDPVKLVIPKGHYQVRFVHTQNSEINRLFFFIKTHKKCFFILALFAYILYLHLSVIPQGTLQSNRKKMVFTPLWNSITDHDFPRLVALGDHFFYVRDGTDPASRTILRKDNINSLKDFEAFLQTRSNPDDLRPLPYYLFPQNSVWPFIQLNNSILSQLSYKLKPASLLTAEDLRSYDILFIGSFHTLGILDVTFNHSELSYHVFPNRIVLNTGSDTLNFTDNADPQRYHIDYGSVRKIPGPGGNTIIILASFHETGTTGIVKYLTDPESIKTLNQIMIRRFGRLPDFFEFLFKSTGYDRTTYKTEILYIQETNPNAEAW